MKTTVSSKGQIVLPAQLRREDDIRPGDRFDVERLDEGSYMLRRVATRPNQGLVALLRTCPAAGWFARVKRTETTDDVATPNLE